MNGWKRGYPPGKYYPGMERDYEVYFTVVGVVWHRKRTPEQLEAYDNNLRFAQ